MRKLKSDWKRVENMTDEEIELLAAEDEDSAPMDEEAWQEAKFMGLEDFLPQPKEQICIRLDREVLEWFRKSGKGYQTKINAALKAFIHQQEARR